MLKCAKCPQKFSTMNALKHHKKSHVPTCKLAGVTVNKDGDRFRCPACSQPYANPDTLRSHFKTCARAQGGDAYTQTPAAPQSTSPSVRASTSASIVASTSASSSQVTGTIIMDERPDQLVPASTTILIGASTSASISTSARHVMSPDQQSQPPPSSGQKRGRPIEDQGEPRIRPNPARSPSLPSSPNPTQPPPPLQKSSLQPRGYTLNKTTAANVDATPHLLPLIRRNKSSFPPSSSQTVPRERKKEASTANQMRNNAYQRDCCVPIWEALEHLKDVCAFCYALGSQDYANHSAEYCLKTRGHDFVQAWRVFLSVGLSFATNTCYGCTLPQFKGIHGYQLQSGRAGCPYNDGIKKVLFMLIHYDTLFKDCPLIPEQYLAVEDPEMVSELKLWLLANTLNDPNDPPFGPFPNYLHVFLWIVRHRESQD